MLQLKYDFLCVVLSEPPRTEITPSSVFPLDCIQTCHSLDCTAAAAAAKSLQLCPTLCDPIYGSPPDSPHSWDSPGKNTGVGCHFLLQCVKVKSKSKSKSEVAQLRPTLSDPMDCNLPGSSAHGIFQPIVLEWGAIAFSVDCTTI